MATHSSTLAWKIPWMEETGRLQSIGWQSVGHDWATSLSLFTLLHWRRKWQPTPVFLPGESQGRGSLVGLLSVGSHRVGHDWSDLPAAAAAAVSLLTLSLLYWTVSLPFVLWGDTVSSKARESASLLTRCAEIHITLTFISWQSPHLHPLSVHFTCFCFLTAF